MNVPGGSLPIETHVVEQKNLNETNNRPLTLDFELCTTAQPAAVITLLPAYTPTNFNNSTTTIYKHIQYTSTLKKAIYFGRFGFQVVWVNLHGLNHFCNVCIFSAMSRSVGHSADFLQLLHVHVQALLYRSR